MEAYIKYQRFVKEFGTDEEIQKFLDELISGGWEIISYNEDKRTQMINGNAVILTVITVMAGKRAGVIKNVL
jgi:N-dimethylarginine dimethylaminohydrolase